MQLHFRTKRRLAQLQVQYENFKRCIEKNNNFKQSTCLRVWEMMTWAMEYKLRGKERYRSGRGRRRRRFRATRTTDVGLKKRFVSVQRLTADGGRRNRKTESGEEIQSGSDHSWTHYSGLKRKKKFGSRDMQGKKSHQRRSNVDQLWLFVESCLFILKL